MDCERAMAFFQEALDGAALDAGAEAHLAECGPCRSRAERLRALDEALSREPELTWTPAHTSRVARRLRRERSRRRLGSLAAAAALLLAAWLSFGVMPEVPALDEVTAAVAERLSVPNSPAAALDEVTGAVDMALTAVTSALPVPASASLAPASIVLLLILNGFALGRPLLACRRKS